MALPIIPEETALPREIDLRASAAHYLAVLRRRWVILLGVMLLVVGAGLVAAASRGPIYQATAILVVPPDPGATSSIVSGDPIIAYLQARLPSGFESQLTVLQSDSFIAEAERRAGILTPAGHPRPTVTVEGRGGYGEPGSIQITVEGRNPNDLAHLANTMLDIHQERLASSSSSGFREAIQLAEKENEDARSGLAKAEATLARFRQAYPVVGPSTHEARAGEYSALNARLPEMESNIAVTKSQIHNLQLRLAAEPRVLTLRRENPRIEKLKNRLDDLKFQRMDLKRDFRPTSREIRDVDKQIAEVQRAIETEPREVLAADPSPNPTRALFQTRLEELEATLQGQEQSWRSAAAEVQAQKTQIDQLSPLEVRLDRLMHNRDVAQTALAAASDRLRDLETRARVWEQLSRNHQAVVRAVVPDRPNQPLKPKNIALLGLLAVLLAGGAALLLEFLDDRIHSPQTVDRSLRLPVLGCIPLVPGGRHPVISALTADTPLVESYRSLRANIGFAAIDAPLRSMIVTSAHEGEGKSTVATNVAITLAMSGRTVVLVDADLRDASLHKILDMPAGPGLAEVILGSTGVEEALCQSSTPGLSVLTSGSASVNPTDLLSMSAMAGLLEALRAQVDVVVLDVPPSLQFTDAQVLATHVDGVLIVVDPAQAKKTEVQRIRDLMDRAYARTIGLVLNRTGHAEGRPSLPPAASDLGVLRSADRKQLPAASPRGPALSRSTRPLKPGHRLSYLGLFLFTAIVYFRPYNYIPALEPYNVALLAALFTLAVFFPSQFRLEGTLSARLPEVRVALYLCLAGLLSIPLAISPSDAWRAFNDPFYKVILIFIVIVNTVRTEQRLKGLLWLALSVTCVLSIGALNDHRLGRAMVEGYRPQGVIRGGLFDNPNDMALHLVTMVPLAVALMLGSTRRVSWFLYGGCAILTVAATVVTYSRAGFLGLLAASAVLAWKLGRRNPRAVAGVAVVALGMFAVLAPHDFGLRLASIFDFGLDPNGSAADRRELLIRSVITALHHPLLGIGIGNFHIVSINEWVSHNSYTQVAAEMGLPAFFLYLSLIVRQFRPLRQIERDAAADPARGRFYYLSVGVQASLVGFMVSSFFASVAYLWYPYYLVGYAVCLARIYARLPAVTARQVSSSHAGRAGVRPQPCAAVLG